MYLGAPIAVKASCTELWFKAYFLCNSGEGSGSVVLDVEQRKTAIPCWGIAVGGYCWLLRLQTKAPIA